MIRPDYRSKGYRAWHLDRVATLWCGPPGHGWYVSFSAEGVRPGGLSASVQWHVSRSQARALFGTRVREETD